MFVSLRVRDVIVLLILSLKGRAFLNKIKIHITTETLTDLTFTCLVMFVQTRY